MTSTTTDVRFGVNSGKAVKVPCKAATTANITLSGEQTIDGVACVTGDRVLVKDQTDGTENGIYNVDTSSWTRTADANDEKDFTQGSLVYISQGSTYAGLLYGLTTSGTIVPGTTSLTFSNINSNSISAYIQTLLDDPTSSAARQTLGVEIGVDVAAYIKNNYAGTTAPTVNDDSSAGYSAGSVWADTTASPNEVYRCTDASVGAAVWLNTSLELGDLGSMASQDASNVSITGGSIGNSVDVQFPSGHISGLLWSNNGTDATNDFDISAGECRSSDDTTNLVLASAQTKQMDAAWATGTNAGALATGATAWAAGVSYHVFIGLISGTVEIIVDSDAGAANAIASNGLTKPKHIFSFLAATGPALPTLHTYENGKNVCASLDVVSNDETSASTGTAANLATFSVPAGVRVIAMIAVRQEYSAATSHLLLTETNQTDTAPGATITNMTVRAGATESDIIAHIRTDTSKQIRYRTSADSVVNMLLIGYTFLR